ncbi:MAG: hypothetical protein LBP33_00985 [Candidatus Adiutrix sp.]|nr:hypothetical protein [Candidatus Adiutrix sp.]
MSEFDPRFHRSPKVGSPELKVSEFRPENFTRLDKVEPIPDPDENFDRDAPPLPPAPDPFQEFTSDRRRPLSALMDDLPSLDGLFNPFDLESEKPVSEEFNELYRPGPPLDFTFEDLDTRDPGVVRTLAQAREKRDETIKAAEEEAARLRQAAETELRGARAEAEAHREALLAEARRQAAELTQSLREAAAEDRAAAEDERRAAREERAAAENSRAEAERQLTSARERIAGLDGERARLEKEMAERRAEQEQAHAAVAADFEARRQTLLDEARAAGHQAGWDQGLNEGRRQGENEARAAFQEKTQGLLQVMDKMENVYNDLWTANGPMMIQLAIAAAEQILNKELDQSRDLAARAFEAAIDFLSQASQIRLLVNPRDIAALEEARPGQRRRLGALVGVAFQPDESLGPGDLIVESDVGRLDATVKHRSEQVLGALKRAFAEWKSLPPARLTPPARAPEESPAEPAAAENEAPEPAPIPEEEKAEEGRT